MKLAHAVATLSDSQPKMVKEKNEIKKHTYMKINSSEMCMYSRMHYLKLHFHGHLTLISHHLSTHA